MRILYLLESRETIGGGVRATRNLAQALTYRQKGITIGIFGPCKDLNNESLRDVVSFPNDGIKPTSREFYQSLKSSIIDFSPDIVHSMGLYTGVAAQLIRSSRRTFALVVTVHRTTYRPRFYPISTVPARWLSSKVDHATFLTTYQEKHYKERLGFSPKRSSIIPNVIPIRNVDSSMVDKLRDTLLKETGSGRLIVYAGRLIPSKQIEMLLETAALLRKQYPVGTVIVGDGPSDYKEMLFGRMKELNLDSSTYFAGFRSNPEEYLAASDIVLFPTQKEALPNLLIESYMLGIPVVTSNIDPMKSLVKHGYNSLVSDKHEPESYAALVSKLLVDSDLYSTISDNSRRTYEENYEPGLVSEKYLQIYSRLSANAKGQL